MLFDYSYRNNNGGKVRFSSFALRQLILVVFIIPCPVICLYILNSGMDTILKIPLIVIFLMFPLIVVVQLSFHLAPYYETFSNVFLTDERKYKRISQAQQSSLPPFDRDLPL